MTRAALHSLLAPPSWLRLPRRSARTRLTLLYGGLFMFCGAVLLTITYVLFEQATDVTKGKGPPVQYPDRRLPDSALLKSAQVFRADVLHQLLVNSGIALVIVAVLALLLGWYFAGRVLRPVRTITATARRISASNLQERLALADADEEFKQLGDTLDDLFARLEAAFEAQRHFVANASHELRTPLTAERTLLQVALANPSITAEGWRSTGQELLASNHEQERLLEALLTLASSEGGLDHRERIDLSTVCDAVLLRAASGIDTLGLHVNTEIRSAPLDGDALLIKRMVANLVDNAVGHNVANGHVQVTTTVTPGGTALLTVANTGRVIPAAALDRLFQPFQRLDPRRTHHKHGHGLGLSIVRAIADAHGATVAAQARPQGGLQIHVTFPPPSPLTDNAQAHASRTRLTREADGRLAYRRQNMVANAPSSKPVPR
jgi:signal transduction histidine kinase